MTTEDIRDVIEAFREAARRADQAGYDAVQLHGAHGYLIHEFFSPLTNQRDDEYGQDLSLIHISEPTRLSLVSRMPSSA